jgi:hypothetical protein
MAWWGQKVMQPEEVIYEPLSVVKGWKIARIIGDEKKVSYWLSALKGLGSEDFLHSLLNNLQGLKPSSVRITTNILEDRDLEAGGHEFILQIGNHKESVLMGSVKEVGTRSIFNSFAGELTRESAEQQAALASLNGYYVVAVAQGTVRARETSSKLLGLALLEPEIEKTPDILQPTRLYTQANADFALILAKRIWEKNFDRAVRAEELSNTVKVWQKQVKEAQIIGECGSIIKHHLINYWRSQGTVVAKDPYIT